MAPVEEVFFPSCAFFFSSVGLILSFVSNFYCGFASSTIEFTEQVDDANTTSMSYRWRAGVWNVEDYDLFFVVSENQIYFLRYFYCVPWNSRTNVERDGYWTASQAFSVLTVVLGGIVGFFTCCVICSESQTSTNIAYVMGMTYLLVVLCQGLVFLFFESNACRDGNGRTSQGNQEFELTWDGCDRSVGANCAIASMVFYFCASLILFTSVHMMRRQEENFRIPTSSTNPPHGDDQHVLATRKKFSITRKQGYVGQDQEENHEATNNAEFAD